VKKNVEKKLNSKKSDKNAEKDKTKKMVSKKSALAKNIDSIDNKNEVKKKNSDKKANAKSVITTKGTASKSVNTDAVKKSTTKVTDKTTVKKTTNKSTDKTTVKATSTKSTAKTASKKATTKSASKTTRKKTATKSKSKSTDIATPKKEPIQILEYYDLPYKYGNTIVRLLAQTPKTLFVYWEVSDSDIENFKKAYGDDFFNKTKPILIVHNLTLNKTSEVEINDFANCWYLNTDDTDCKFEIELARKNIETTQNDNDNSDEYLFVAQSNDLQSPNDHILFEKLQEFVVFTDVSNNKKIKKNIKSFKFLKDIYKFYKDMYDEELLNNPSSQFKF
jgi:hypothetical protein